MTLQDEMKKLFPNMQEGDSVNIMLTENVPVQCGCGGYGKLNRITGIYHGIRDGKDYVNVDLPISIFYLEPYLECPECGKLIDYFYMYESSELEVGI